MEFESFITLVQHLPVIETGMLFPGVAGPDAVKVQISRWTKSGKLIRLKKGVYLLARPYRKVEPYEYALASALKKPSYISLEKALEFHGLIPEAVPVYTSVTTKRQARFTTPIGVFSYRHLKTSLFWGYDSLRMNNQTAFMAAPEKALLDLIYLNHVAVSPEYLEGLRLQNTDRIDPGRLARYAKRFERPRMMKAAEMVQKFISDGYAGERFL